MALSNGSGRVKSERIGQSNAAKYPLWDKRSTTIIETSFLKMV